MYNDATRDLVSKKCQSTRRGFPRVKNLDSKENEQKWFAKSLLWRLYVDLKMQEVIDGEDKVIAETWGKSSWPKYNSVRVQIA